MSCQPKFLSGLRVLDLSQYLPGPFATLQMAELGAEVIKIEPPDGDPMRRFMVSGKESVSPIYNHLNRGKKILTLDLKTEAGKLALTDQIQHADVLMESYRPGVLERLGFGYERLKTLNPKLVHCALSGFGQTGPYRDRAGHDLTYCAVAGILSLTGTVTGPVMTYPPIADHAGAMQAVNSILAALLNRERTGKGCYLDISLCESALNWQYLGLNEIDPKRQGLLLNGGAAYYNVYETADKRFIALGALEPKFWRAFCQAVRREEWIQRQNEPLPQQQLISELRLLFLQQPLRHWNDLLLAVDCCYEPVPTLNEIQSHPQVRARKLLDGKTPNYPAWIEGLPIRATDPLPDPEPV